MKFFSIVGAVLASTTTVNCRPLALRAAQATGQAFEITNLVLSDVNASNTTLTFNVSDLDPLSNETATCTATWQHNSTGYPSGPYQRCGNTTTFAWRMENVVNLRNFTIGLDHSFEDPAIGDPPYDHITNFGRTAINETVISCQGLGGRTACQQKDDIIYAKIYATIA